MTKSGYSICARSSSSHDNDKNTNGCHDPSLKMGSIEASDLSFIATQILVTIYYLLKSNSSQIMSHFTRNRSRYFSLPDHPRTYL
jgi:hypothetical protein